MNIQLVLFDMDGVIFEGKNFWLDLHRHYRTLEKGVVFANKYLDNDYGQLARLVAGNLWKGKSASVVHAMVKRRKYQPGILEVFNFLHTNFILSAIISSGPYELALRAQRDLRIAEVRANNLVVENELIQGEVEVMVPDAEKMRVGREVMEEMGIHPSKVAFVGDSDSDIELAKIVELPIAYNSESEALIKACKVVLRYGELGKLRDILQQS